MYIVLAGNFGDTFLSYDYTDQQEIAKSQILTCITEYHSLFQIFSIQYLFKKNE